MTASAGALDSHGAAVPRSRRTDQGSHHVANVVTLSQVYAIDNLRRAWRWLLTNREPQYKNYFRHSYRAYALAADEHLEALRARLRSEAYEAQHAVKTYHLKKSGGLRAISLLTVEDQIVYQAFGNVIAEQLIRRVGRRYEAQVFGHLYAGKTSFTFYRDWRRGYKKFTHAFREAHGRGLSWTASFDLTACYDSIDHAVLTHFLGRMGLTREVSRTLCSFLSRWTAASDKGPIYQGHGIPQGPLPSGLIAECILQHLDRTPLSSRECYLRYVDDIRLLAGTERAIRRRLVWLDLASKEIGLFPQVDKIGIHKVTNVDSEIRGISHPPELGTPAKPAAQPQLRRRLIALSLRHHVTDETRFKFVLGQTSQWAPLTKRLARILEGQPHLYPSVSIYLSLATRISRQGSRRFVTLLKHQGLYPAFTSALIRALQQGVHQQAVGPFVGIARVALRRGDPELREAAGSALLRHGALTWAQTKYYALRSRSWYVRGGLARAVDPAQIGDPSYEWLLNELLRDTQMDVALVAADRLLQSGASVRPPTSTVNRAAQVVLKQAGMLGRVSRSALVADILAATCGSSMRQINWRAIFGGRYGLALRKLARWNGYRKTDPTAWVNLTDTINDLLLDRLFAHERGAIGHYKPGDVGSVLNSGSRFARRYPSFFTAVRNVHIKRLESDLSHAIVRKSGRATRRIEHKELRSLVTQLRAGLLEVWRLW